MRTFAGLYDEFSAALNFPDYFGRNFNALHDSLRDLTYLADGGACTLFVLDAPSVLASETADDRQALMGLLEDACAEWNRPIAQGNPWDRPAVPFHVVFSPKAFTIT